jgi:hypothetical protein
MTATSSAMPGASGDEHNRVPDAAATTPPRFEGGRGQTSTLDVPTADPAPLRVYLSEIGALPRLTPAQEAEIGRRTRVAQRELQRALAIIPSASRDLLVLRSRLRRGEVAFQDVFVHADGSALEAADAQRLLADLGRIRRLNRRMTALGRAPRGDSQRAARGNDRIAVQIRTIAAAIQEIVAELPFRASVVDRLVNHARRRRTNSARLAQGRSWLRPLLEEWIALILSSRAQNWETRGRVGPLAASGQSWRNGSAAS